MEHSGPARRRGPSMADVAAVARVSGQTVSRVANGHGNVDQHTRQRVLSAMRELGYRPNGAARALRSGRFRTLGVVLHSLSSVGNTRTLEAVAAAAAEAGYGIALLPVARPTRGGVRATFDRLDEHAVDGVLVITDGDLPDHAELEIPSGLPAVVVDQGDPAAHPVVDTDQAQGARLATEHLLGLGHATVWHVAGPPDSWSAVQRMRSWRDTLARHGRPVPEPLIGDWSAATGERHGSELAARPAVTAVFCANDQTALGVLKALHDAGRAVPGDVSVVGFDDIDEAASFWPALTTVRQSFADVGREAVAALLAVIERRDPPRQVIVPTRLVVRASSGPPASGPSPADRREP